MPSLYRTQQGEMIDEICWRHYGTSVGTTEIVFEYNRDLAEKCPVPVAGTLIFLPVIDVVPQRHATRLWE